MTCYTCNSKNDTLITGYNLNIYPDADDSIINILDKSMSSIVTKSSTFCMSDINHTEVLATTILWDKCITTAELLRRGIIQVIYYVKMQHICATTATFKT